MTNESQPAAAPVVLPYLGACYQSLQLQLKVSATRQTLLIYVGDEKAQNMRVAIDQAPLLLPAVVGVAHATTQNELHFAGRVVLLGMEYQSEFIENPEGLVVFLSHLLTHQVYLLPLPTEFRVSLLPHTDTEFHQNGPEDSIYVDFLIQLPVTAEVMEEFLAIYRLPVIMSQVGANMEAVTQSADTSHGGH